jgi:hypothetical protein
VGGGVLGDAGARSSRVIAAGGGAKKFAEIFCVKKMRAGARGHI